MTFSVTIKARAVPVTVKASDDQVFTPVTIQPWQERRLDMDGSAQLTITEAEPAADPEPEQSSDEAVDAAEVDSPMSRTETVKDAMSSTRSRRAPAADPMTPKTDSE